MDQNRVKGNRDGQLYPYNQYVVMALNN